MGYYLFFNGLVSPNQGGGWGNIEVEMLLEGGIILNHEITDDFQIKLTNNWSFVVVFKGQNS